MSIQSLEKIRNNPDFSIEQVSKMFSALFENKKSKSLVNDFFSNSLVWFAFECQENKNSTKLWLDNLKGNIKNTTV